MLDKKTLDNITSYHQFNPDVLIFSLPLNENSNDVSTAKAVNDNLIELNQKSEFVFKNQDIQNAFASLSYLKSKRLTNLDEIDPYDIFRDFNNDYELGQHRVCYIVYFLYHSRLNDLILHAGDLNQYKAYGIINGINQGLHLFDFSTDQYLQLAEITHAKSVHSEFLVAVRKLPAYNYPVTFELMEQCIFRLKEPHLTDVLSHCMKGIADTKGISEIHSNTEELLNSSDNEIVSIALFTVSIFDYNIDVNKPFLHAYISSLKSAILSGDDKLAQSAVYAYSNLIPFDASLLPVLKDVFSLFSKETRLHIINLLFRNFQLLKDNSTLYEILHLFPTLFNEVNPFPNLFFLLDKLISADRNVELLDFLNAYIGSEFFNEEIFEPYLRLYATWRQKNSPFFQNIIGQYLNHNNSNFHKVVHGITQEMTTFRNYNLTFTTEFMNTLTESDKDFVINKLMGYIHNHEIQLSLLLSLLDHNPEQAYISANISGLISQYIGYNYHSIVEILNKRKKEVKPSSQEYIIGAIEAIEEYYKAKTSLPALSEFNPSAKRVEIFMKAHNKQLKEIIESKPSEPSFFDHVHKVRLKAGKTWFSKIDGKYNKPSALSSLGHSFELPRGEFIDPTNQTLLRISFRAYKRK